jgi:hypothetical protein
MGGLDFSPIFAFIALNFLQVLFVQFAIESGLPVWLSVDSSHCSNIINFSPICHSLRAFN